MDNGMNSIKNHDASAKNKTRKRKGCLLWFLVVALAYVLLTLWAQWTPPVRGVVVDAETGQPIPNAEIIREGLGGSFFLEPRMWGWEESAKTDGRGKFSIGGTLKLSNAPLGGIDVPIPIKFINKVDLYVYHPDYVTSFTEIEIGKVGFTDRVVTRKESFEEKRILYESMRFKIKLTKPKTERDWVEKCDQDIRSYMQFQNQHRVDEWLFNDLVGYLERYPNGEKAGEYALLLLDRLAIGDSRANIDEEFRSGELDLEKIKLIIERNLRIIEAVSKVTPPSHPGVVVTFSDYNQRLEFVKNCTFYLQGKYGKGGDK